MLFLQRVHVASRFGSCPGGTGGGGTGGWQLAAEATAGPQILRGQTGTFRMCVCDGVSPEVRVLLLAMMALAESEHANNGLLANSYSQYHRYDVGMGSSSYGSTYT